MLLPSYVYTGSLVDSRPSVHVSSSESGLQPRYFSKPAHEKKFFWKPFFFHLGDASLGATPRSTRKHETRITSPTHKCASWAQGTQTLFLARSSMWAAATNPAGAGRGRIRREKARPFELPVLPTPILRVLVARMRGCDMWRRWDKVAGNPIASWDEREKKKKREKKTMRKRSKLEKEKKALSTLKYGETETNWCKT